MKTLFKIVIWSLVFISIDFVSAYASKKNTKEYNLVTHSQKLGYSLGIDFGESLNKMNPDIDLGSLLLGAKDAYNKNKYRISPVEMNRIKRNFATQRHNLRKFRARKSTEITIKEGLDFLSQNKTKKEIHVTDSGLQYLVISPGTGGMPGADDFVTIDYKGTLIDGTPFINTFGQKPYKAVVHSFVPGLAESLQLMRAGGHYQVFVPARLGYGYKGWQNKIKPFSVLVYDVTLLKVQRATKYTKQNKKSKAVDTKLLKQSPPVMKHPDRDYSKLYFGTLKDASFSLYSSYTNKLVPNINNEELNSLCDMVSAPKYTKRCLVTFNKRLSYLKQGKIVEAAFKITDVTVNEKQKSAKIDWRETLKDKLGKEFNNLHSIEANFEQIDDKWQVISAKIL